MVTVKQIEKILKEYPTLNYNGFGLPFDKKDLNNNIITQEQYDDKFQKLRKELLKSVDQINYVITWLQDVQKAKSINKRRTSYGLKHMAEIAAPGKYISNGCFIVGAILAGFTIEINEPNACFNISEKSLNQKRK